MLLFLLLCRARWIKRPNGERGSYVIFDYEPEEDKIREAINELLKKHKLITAGEVLLKAGENPEEDAKRASVFRVAKELKVLEHFASEKKIRRGGEEGMSNCIESLELVDQLKEELENQSLPESAKATMKAMEKKLVQIVCRD